VNEESEPKPLLKDWRVRGLISGAVLVGFLIGLLVFGAPWHLPPAWGDIPTWLLAVGAAAAAGVALLQLRILREQMAEDAKRNIKRDKLLDRQLTESEARAASERRRQAEDIDVRFARSTGHVVNNSRRPIRDVTCKIISKIDRHSMAGPEQCGLVNQGPGGSWSFFAQRQASGAF
jgi:hypothetical protein